MRLQQFSFRCVSFCLDWISEFWCRLDTLVVVQFHIQYLVVVQRRSWQFGLDQCPPPPPPPPRFRYSYSSSSEIPKLILLIHRWYFKLQDDQRSRVCVCVLFLVVGAVQHGRNDMNRNCRRRNNETQKPPPLLMMLLLLRLLLPPPTAPAMITSRVHVFVFFGCRSRTTWQE